MDTSSLGTDLACASVTDTCLREKGVLDSVGANGASENY